MSDAVEFVARMATGEAFLAGGSISLRWAKYIARTHAPFKRRREPAEYALWPSDKWAEGEDWMQRTADLIPAGSWRRLPINPRCPPD